MLDAIDMNAILADVAKFQQHASQAHAKLTHPKQRQVIGDLLAKIEESKQQVRVTWPKAITALEKSAHESQAKAKANLARFAEIKKQIAAAAAAKAAAAERMPPKKEQPSFDFQLGQRLSSEMLAHFEQRSEVPPSERISDREIWQDWNWATSEKN